MKNLNVIMASQLTNSSTQVLWADNGHVYEIVINTAGMTWNEANTIAQNKYLNGVRGHLATITSASENDIAFGLVSKQTSNQLYAALGGTDSDTEGNWRWVGGPEHGSSMGYTNWVLGQPDNAIGWGYDQNYLAYSPVSFNQPGKWDDGWQDPSLVGQPQYSALIVEYSADKYSNTPPSGAVNITGNLKLGQILNVTNTLADIDGIGAISYQWMAEGQAINGATGSNFTITQAQLGRALTAVASYTDGGGTLESVASSAVQVANYNLSAAENTTTITTIAATNTALGTAPKFTLTGADASLFKISNKGVLTFSTAKDYEQPIDANKDGIYEVSVVITNTKTLYKLTKDFTVGVEFTAIQGTANADTLKGTKGWDTLDGLAGNDKLTGDVGLDSFIISAGSDSITDFNNLGTALGQEILQVSSSATVSATLKTAWTATSDSINRGTATVISSGLNIDLSAINQGQGWNLTNTGKTATLKGSMFNDVLTGGTATDTLLGGAGNDVLNGGKGVDYLTGGAGADTFRFSGGTGTANADHITDFVSGLDKIQIDATLLKNEIKGQLSAGSFISGTKATTTSEHFVYDNGNLWFDADGNGKVKAVLIGVLDSNAALTVNDVWVV